jgi:hypothetical protein
MHKANCCNEPIDIDWFYKINKDGLCIDKKDLHMIIDDPNIPKDIKKQIQKFFLIYQGNKL